VPQNSFPSSALKGRFHILWATALAAVVLATAFHFDTPVLAWFSKDLTREMAHSATAISRWGDWPPLAAGIGAILFTAAACRAQAIARGALVILLAASLAGSTASALRMVTGRARPMAKIAPGWHGPHSGRHKLNSFPSAHTAVVAGAAVATALLVPWSTVPACTLILLMAWARMRAGAHHLSDVVAGALLGGFLASWLLSRIPARWPAWGWLSTRANDPTGRLKDMLATESATPNA